MMRLVAEMREIEAILPMRPSMTVFEVTIILPMRPSMTMPEITAILPMRPSMMALEVAAVLPVRPSMMALEVAAVLPVRPSMTMAKVPVTSAATAKSALAAIAGITEIPSFVAPLRVRLPFAFPARFAHLAIQLPAPAAAQRLQRAMVFTLITISTHDFFNPSIYSVPQY